MINKIKKHIHEQLLYALILTLITGIFVIFVQYYRMPDIDSVTDFLLALPDYQSLTKCEELTGVYQDISSTNEINVYKATDGSAREFAVTKADNLALTDELIEKLKARQAELNSEFQGNNVELERIEYFKIVNVDTFVTFLIYDTQKTAETALHEYFSLAIQ